MGLHISVLYSPDVSLSEIAAQFLLSVDDPEKLKQFRNEWLAEPRREIIKTSSTNQGHLATLGFDGYEQPAPDWWQGEETPRAPEFVRAITWGFDVQGSEVWGLCRGWGNHGENIVLWCGKFAGTTDLDDAAVAFRREWIIQGGEIVRPRRGLMDSGYRTHEVYRVCARTPGLLPSKGRQDGTLPMSMSQVDRQDQNRRTVGHVELAIVWTTYWQDQVEASLGAGPGRGRGVCHLPQNPPSFLYRHLLAERKTAVKSRNGTIAYVWKAHSHENHLRDCIVYSTAAAGHANLLDMRPRKAPPVEIASTPQAQTVPATVQNPPKRAETALSRLIKARSAGAIRVDSGRT
jgi:phage terminase large subunit GpA-like protein